VTARDVADLGTLACVWAHPDDEAYLCAGIMALAAAAGSRVVCVTATRGEAGDPARSHQEMARIREAELAACLEILGVREHHWLGYVDGTCAQADPGEAAGRIADILAEVRPDTVLTFGPEGLTGHPDHMAVSRWVGAAAALVGNGTRVHHAAHTVEWAAEFKPALDGLNVFAEGLPPRTPTAELSIEIALPPDAVSRKIRALRAQPSQTDGLIGILGEDFLARSWAIECYRPG